MPKHNQTKRLPGSLTDFQTAPQPILETPDERLDRLERRILQTETLLNDVMQQLDKPYRDQPQFNGKPKQAKQTQKPHSNGKPKQAKTKQAKSKQAKPPTTPPTRTEEQVKQAEQAKQAKQEKDIALRKAQQDASAQRTAETFEKLQTLLASSDPINSEELKAVGITNNQQRKMRKTAAYKESGIQCQKMPDKTYDYSLEPTTKEHHDESP